MKKIHKLIIVILIVAFTWVFEIVTNWEEINQPIEERAAVTIAYEPFRIIKFEKGCICFSHGTGETDKGILFLTYLENDLTSTDYLAIRGNIGESYSHFIDNSNLTRCLAFNLNIFSNNIIYYSCCKTESARPVIVNGEDVELHDVEFEWNDETYNLTFWFYMAKKGEFPKVEFKDKR